MLSPDQLGIVTYNIAKDWTLAEILERLPKLGYSGFEARTTHAHGLEVALSPTERADVRARIADAGLLLAGLGSAFEFQSPDPAEVRANIEGAKEYVRLAHDLACPGIKVRPNGLPPGAELGPTLRRIAESLHTLGDFAEGFGVEIRVEVHGAVTQEPENLATILDLADHPNVFACWNSNPQDVADGSIRSAFDRIGPSRIREVHLRDLTDESYPWRELFRLLTESGYGGFTLAEVPESTDPERVLRYFRVLWTAYQPAG